MDSADKASVIIGLGFLGLVAFIFWFTLRTMNTTDGFLAVWSAVGPIVGVVIGVMPAHFFRTAAKAANARADRMAHDVADMGKRMADMAEEMAHGSR
jgi:hypothetical protein